MKSETSETENGVESTVEKRARFERFAMTVLTGAGAGRVNVRNDSYGSEAGEHIYNVRVDDGEAVECSCPADEYQPGPCKHRVAVENRPLVVSSASAASSTHGYVEPTRSEAPDMGGGETTGVVDLA